MLERRGLAGMSVRRLSPKWTNVRIHALKIKTLLSCSGCGRGFGSVFHHQYLKSQPLSVGIFFARNASVGAVSGLGLLSTALPKSSVSAHFPPFFSLCSLLPS